MQIYVYTTPNCPQCRMTKKVLDEGNIPYLEIDLTEDDVAMQMVKDLGYASSPIVMADKAHWSGFRHDKLLNTIMLYRTNALHAAA
jgi:glutaredoxin-like protein NrdH